MSSNEDASAAPASAIAQAAPPRGEEIPYHRLARLRPRYRWWRMLVTGIVGVALYVAILFLLIVPLVVASLLVPGWGAEMQVLLTTVQYFDLDRPWLFLEADDDAARPLREQRIGMETWVRGILQALGGDAAAGRTAFVMATDASGRSIEKFATFDTTSSEISPSRKAR
jgi:hypothetical protein